MYDLCDIVIDNHGEIGDACISLENAPQKVAPTSTVIGATILNSIFSEAAKLVSEETDEMIPVFASANMDHGDDFNKKLFDKLLLEYEEIENKLGFSMDWQRLDNKKASRIIYYIDGLDFDNHDNYDKLINEVIDRVITIKETFRNHILPI